MYSIYYIEQKERELKRKKIKKERKTQRRIVNTENRLTKKGR